MTLSDFVKQPYKDNQVMPQFAIDLFSCLTGLQMDSLFKKQTSSELMGKVLRQRLLKYDVNCNLSKAETI